MKRDMTQMEIEAQQKAHDEWNASVAERQKQEIAASQSPATYAEQVAAAKAKPFHLRNATEKSLVHAIEMAEATVKANTPPPRSKEQRLADEACHNAVVDWRASEPTYSGSTEDAAHVWAAMNTLNLPRTAAGFAQAFAYTVKNGMVKPVAQQPQQPATPLEKARAKGWTRTMIDNTSPAKLRKMIKDNPELDAQIAAIYAAGE
jgi:hypothetical protein